MRMERIVQAIAAVFVVAAAGACTSSGTGSPTASSPAKALPLPAGVYVEVRTTAGNQLYALAQDGSTWRYVTDEPAPDGPHEAIKAAAPDLSRFLVVEEADLSLWSINASGGDRHLIVAPPQGQRVCGAGFDAAADRLWYGIEDSVRNLLGLYTIRPDGTDRRQLSGLTGAPFCTLAWSADASTMALVRAQITDWPPPAGAYHKLKVLTGGAAGHDIVIGLPDTVKVENVMAISPDGRTVVVSTEPIDERAKALGRQMYLADLGSRKVTQIALPSALKFGFATMFRFDMSGRLLGTLYPQETGGTAKIVVAVFDQHGRYASSLPNPPGDSAGDLVLWPVVP